MGISPAARVGMVTVLALLIIGIAWQWIAGTDPGHLAGRKFLIKFARVEGITEGSFVRIAGVQVGKVTHLEFKERDVLVTITITPQFDSVVLTKESIYTIGQSFVGEKWVEIQPMEGEAITSNYPNGPPINGVPPVTFDELMSQAEGTLSRVDQSMQGLSKFVDDPEFQTNIKQTVVNFNRLSRQFQGTARDISHLVNGVSGKLDVISNNTNVLLTNLNTQVNGLAGDMRGVTQTLNRVAVKSEGQIQTILTNVRVATTDLRTSMVAVKKLLSDKKNAEELQATLVNIRKSTEEVEGILSDVRLITSNPKTQDAIKDTFQQAHDAAKEAKELVQKINTQLDKWGIGRKGGKGGEPTKLYELDLESEWSLNNGSQSTNFNLWLLPRGPLPVGLELGEDSIGNRNLTNVEFASPHDNFRPRAGIIRSQFGFGVDDFIGSNAMFSVDLYDPSYPQLDVLGRFGGGKGLYFMGGVRDSLHKDRQPVIGVGKSF